MNSQDSLGQGATPPENGSTTRTKKNGGKKIKLTPVRKMRGVRRRGPKQYVVMALNEALIIGRGIVEHGAGHPIKRVTLLEKLRLADNQTTRSLITNSGKYGITVGSYQAETIKLTEAGVLAADPAVPERKRIQAQFELGIKNVEPFNRLYSTFSGGKLPAVEVMKDTLEDLDQGDRAQCTDIFISNAKYVGILKELEGAQHLLAIETLLDELPAARHGANVTAQSSGAIAVGKGGNVESDKVDFDKICFFIAPIGDEGTEHRQHSDAILASFVEPTLSEHKLKIVRADKITSPGMISAQVFEYIIKSKLVVVDMSFHNPNVFYELCLRHVTGKPTVHIIRASDKIPFDVANFRTVAINMESVYSVLASLDTYRAEISLQIRQALADGVSNNNPVLAFCPTAKFTF